MAERQTVLVDMDGVLADFDQEAAARVRARHPSIPALGTRQNFYFFKDFEEEHHKSVLAVTDEKGFFENLPLLENALEGWQRIIDLGYRPRICSSQLLTNPHCEAEKLVWLERHFVPVFGAWVVETAIITRHKHHYDGIALIDDRPEMDKETEAPWSHVVFDQPYNQDSRALRLRGWLDPTLEETLDIAASRYAA